MGYDLTVASLLIGFNANRITGININAVFFDSS